MNTNGLKKEVPTLTIAGNHISLNGFIWDSESIFQRVTKHVHIYLKSGKLVFQGHF